MTKRVSIIGSSSSASVIPGWNDFEFQQLERALFTEGVIQGIGGVFAVSERGAGANMTVDVASGRAIIEITNPNLNHGETYKVWFDNDATVSVSVPTADPTNERIDRIVLRVDVSIDPDGNSENVAIIELIEGTPAGSPSAPATPSNAISLATVSVPASDTTISDAQITDDRSFVEIDSNVLQDLQREATALTTTRLQVADATELTISSGAITVTQPFHKVDTESDASSDDLDTITAGYGAGEIIILFPEDDGRTVTIKNGTGNILTADGQDVDLDTDDKSITLIRTGSNWKELTRGVGSPSTDQDMENIGTVTAASSGVGASDTGENTMSPTWNGSNSVSGLAAGDCIHVRVGGNYRLDSGLLVLLLKFGGQDVGRWVAPFNANSAERAWHMDVWINIRTVGASGTVYASGICVADDDASAGIIATSGLNPVGQVTLDNTGSEAIELSARFTASDGNHTCAIQTGSIIHQHA